MYSDRWGYWAQRHGGLALANNSPELRMEPLDTGTHGIITVALKLFTLRRLERAESKPHDTCSDLRIVLRAGPKCHWPWHKHLYFNVLCVEQRPFVTKRTMRRPMSILPRPPPCLPCFGHAL